MKLKKLRAFFVILLVVCLALTSLAGVVYKQWPDDNLHIVVCDVGQGDAILLLQRFDQVLVDAGPKDEKILQCLREQMPFWDRQIEWIIPTHLDSDHIGGFAAVLDRFTVKNLLAPKDTKQSADFERFEQAVLREQQSGMRVLTPEIGMKLNPFAAGSLRVLYAPIGQIGTVSAQKVRQTETQLWDAHTGFEINPVDSNNRSTVLSLQFGLVSLLLAGDLEAPVEQALIQQGMVTDHTILKVGHHGSKSSSSASFLQVVRPELALISVGKNNRYGHPATSTLERLVTAGVKRTLRTDQLGTIVIETDGRSLWLPPPKR